MTLPSKPKVYIFANGRFGTEDVQMLALADDGEVLAGHICSSPSFARGDLHDRPSRHDAYVRKYGAWGDGDRYELVECTEPPAEVLERARRLDDGDQGESDSNAYPRPADRG